MKERGKYPSSLHAHDGRAPSSPRRSFVVEGGNVVARGEQLSYRRALHALAAPVGEPHRVNAEAAALVEIIGDDGHDVTRSEGMEVELSGDREDEGLALVLRRTFVVGQRETRTSNEPELSTK
jgi:hypothetical protein